MSNQIPTHFVKQYHANIDFVSQQKPSRFESAVRVVSQRGERQFFEQIGPVEAQPVGARHSDTPLYETPHLRRAVDLEDWDWADMVDDFDLVRLIADPKSSYVQNAVMAFNRKKDDVIIAAMLGDARTEKEGNTLVPLPATQTIPMGTGNDAPLTVKKLRDTRQLFWENEVDESIPLYMAVGPAQLNQLLGTTEVTSADYNVVRALVNGEVNSFMGFQFIRTNRLPFDDVDGIRSCIAWAKDGVLMAKGMDTRVTVGLRADKRYSWQPYVRMSIGATRLEEEKVVKVECSDVIIN